MQVKNPSRQTQQDLETIFSKYQLLDVLKTEFSKFLESNGFTSKDENYKLYTDILVQIYLHKQADPETMVGVLSPEYGTPQGVADKLLIAVEIDLLDYNPITERFILIYSISKDVEDMIDRYQYPLPMVIEPKEIKHNNDTGYLTISGSIILNGSSYFKNKDLCIDHLNRSNKIPLELDFSVINSPQGKYVKPEKNTKEGEGYKEYSRRVKQALVFFSTSKEIMEGISTLTDKIYLTYKYDRRGRVYSSGYHINPQGSDYHKAVLILHEKEIIK
jgi:hypothetical protein